MDVTCIIFGILFIGSGLLFASGKLLVHVTPWQMMPAEEKEKIDVNALCVNIGEVIGLSGIIFLFNGIFPDFRSHWFVLSMIAWMIVAGLDLWHIEKSGRYIRPQSQNKKGGK